MLFCFKVYEEYRFNNNICDKLILKKAQKLFYYRNRVVLKKCFQNGLISKIKARGDSSFEKGIYHTRK